MNRYVIPINDIVGIAPGKKDINYVCTVREIERRVKNRFIFY